MIRFWGVMAAMVAIGQACIPSQEEVEALGKDMQVYASKKMCTPVGKVKPGSCPPAGKKEWNYFWNGPWTHWEKLIKDTCKKGLPDRVRKDADAVYTKCHKPGANYCNEKSQAAMKKCAVEEAKKLIPGYMFSVPEYCDCIKQIIEDFRSKHEPVAKKQIDAYDNWKINKAGC
ncbi:hypothetical protein HDE_10446 [Halotydeus destructor]|nr:hypothetical protein HDE_10446 [Halotydeus destructor]